MLNANLIYSILFSVLAGILPAIFWLWFWLREDRLRPEPKRYLAYSFVSGALAVILILSPDLFQLWQDQTSTFDLMRNFIIGSPIIPFLQNIFNIPVDIDLVILATVVIISPILEELLKFIFTYIAALRKSVNDEPIDAAIYLVTAALGFAAMENTIYIFTHIFDPSSSNYLTGLIITNTRFIGPSLTHLISSATIGLFMGFAFYKGRFTRTVITALGILTAIILHSFFNLLIIMSGSGAYAYLTVTPYIFIWIAVAIILWIFERVKRVNK